MIELDMQNDIAAATEAVGAIPQRVRPAARRALRQTGTKMWKPIRSDAAKLANVPVKALRRRVFRHLSRSRDALSLWFGAYRVGLSQLGKARQTKRGVRVGKRFYFGAFLGRGKLAGRGIFIRYGSPHFDPNVYATPKRNPSPDSIVRAKGVEIGPHMAAAVAANESRLRQYFGQALREELLKAGR